MDIQQATTIDQYFTYNDEIENEVIIYLMKIHPRHWTVMGNLSNLEDRNWMLNYKKKLNFIITKKYDLSEDQVEMEMNIFQFYY